MDEIKYFRENFNTKLSEDEEIEYQRWITNRLQSTKRDFSRDEDVYDMRGYWKNEQKERERAGEDGAHFPDRYKKPSHPTFSNESIYSKGEFKGGSWSDGDVFTPSEWNMRRFRGDKQKALEWFAREKPDVTLRFKGDK